MNAEQIIDLITYITVLNKSANIEEYAIYHHNSYCYEKTNSNTFFVYKNLYDHNNYCNHMAYMGINSEHSILYIDSSTNSMAFTNRGVSFVHAYPSTVLIEIDKTDKSDFFNLSLENEVLFTYEELIEIHKTFTSIPGLYGRIELN